MNDFLPEQTAIWQTLEALLRRLTRQYGYHEIRMPIVEKTALFKRSIGEVTEQDLERIFASHRYC